MELSLSFTELMHYFRKNLIKFALVVLAFGVIAGLMPLKVHPVYSASSIFYVTCGSPEYTDSDYRLQYTNILYSRVQSAVALANANDLIAKTAEEVGVPKGEITKITAEQLNSAPVVKLTLSTTNAAKADKLANTAVSVLMEQLVEQFPDPQLTTGFSDSAAPVHAKSRKITMVKSGILGMIVGFIFCVCFGIIVLLSDRSVRNGRYAEDMLKTRLLAEFPAALKEDRQDSGRKLRTAALNQAKGCQTFLVTNVCEHNGGDGVAVSLARALSLTGKKVLLADADLRSPKLSSLLKVSEGHSLADVAGGTCPAEQAAVPVPGVQDLFLLAGTPVQENPADLFAASGFSEALAKLSGLYDYVVLYAPAEIQYPDAETLAGQAQAVILSVKYGSTPFVQLSESCKRIQTAGGNLIGFVMTGA